MGFVKKILRSTSEPASSKAAVPAASPVLINQGDVDPPLRVNPASISHAFVALAHADMSYADKIGKHIEYFMRLFQPRLWSPDIKAKFVTIAANVMENGLLDITSVRPALESHGLRSPYSIVFSILELGSYGGGVTKILAGFAYADSEPKLFLARNDGCIPA